MRAPGSKTEKPGPRQRGKGKHVTTTTATAAGGDDDDVAMVKIRRRKGPLINLLGPAAAAAAKEDKRGGEGDEEKGKKKRGEGYGARTDYTATGMMMTMRPGSPTSGSPSKELIDGTE